MIRPHLPLQGGAWICILVLLTAPGCSTLNFRPKLENWIQQDKPVKYIGNRPLTEYRDHNMEIAHPILDTVPEDIRDFPAAPRTIKQRMDANETWDIELNECVQLALMNNKIVRRNDRSTIQGNSSRVLTSPDGNMSIWDPAIQETGVLFGGRGMESALSAFDPQFTTRLNAGRSEVTQNNIFGGGGLPAGSTLVTDSSSFAAGLSKQFGNGGSMSLSHSIDYTQNNIPTALFPSSYAGNIRADFRQPLAAGSGVEFTRIAGPVTQNINGLSGVNQGVLIARINNDMTIADFESNVTDMVFDVEKLYWDLSLAYRRYAAAIKNREAGLKTWQDTNIKLQVGAEGGDGFLEAQARDAYYDRKAQEDAALATIDSLEGSMRRLCGLPLNDGRILRPVTPPVAAEFQPDWTADLALALTKRVELRRQKWNIKSLELQLLAAKNLVNPRFDLVANYQINGFGDRLMSDYTRDGVTEEGFHNFYDSLLRGHQQSWTTGFEFSMPLGLRAANAQVRNIELRLAKAREVLRNQEHDITFELAQAYQDLSINWENAENYFNRRLAAEQQADFIEQQRLRGKKEATLRDQLEAQAHEAQAEAAYFQAVTDYTKSIAHIAYRKGALLEMNNIYLTEGAWNPQAYQDALRRAWQRTYGIQSPKIDRMIESEPPPFSTDASQGPISYGLDPSLPLPSGEMLPDGTTVPQPAPIPVEGPRPLPPADEGFDVPPPPTAGLDDSQTFGTEGSGEHSALKGLLNKN